MSIVVMGVSGCGKSTVGALLAQRIGCSFVEADRLHSAQSVEKMRRGEPLTDEDRWPWLDRVGAALAKAIAADGIAVAACSALRKTYRARLRAAAGAPTRFILLENSREVIMRRLTGRSDHYMPPSLLDSQFQTLERPSPDECATTLRTDAPPDAVCGRAIEWLLAEQVRA